MDSVLFHGHPGEGLELQMYQRHRAATLFKYGMNAEQIAQHMGLPVAVVRQAIAEEIDSLAGEEREHDEW